MNAINAIRWSLTAAFAGVGVCGLTCAIWLAFAGPSDGSGWFIFIPICLCLSGLFLRVAYLILKKQYRRLASLSCEVAAMAVALALLGLPVQLGVFDRVHAWVRDSDSWLVSVVALLMVVFQLLAALVAARWVYRGGQALISRRFDGPS
jgi:hypothetical protein